MAYYLKDFIKAAMAKHGFQVAGFIERPMEKVLANLKGIPGSIEALQP